QTVVQRDKSKHRSGANGPTKRKEKSLMKTCWNFNISGTTFGHRQGYLCDLEKHPERRVFLWREPRNKTDANAIKVVADAMRNGKRTKYDLGYVPREVAAEIAPIMDKKGFIV